jgi:hypothetical protein
MQQTSGSSSGNAVAVAVAVAVAGFDPPIFFVAVLGIFLMNNTYFIL